MLVRIIIGLITSVVGFLIVWKPRAFLEFLGEQPWAEKIFGPGNTITAYKVIGVLIIIVGFLIITNLIENTLLWFFSPVLNNLKGLK